jgi:Na+-translocating ferredoxin:NAD+ oxidoreductase RnfD subunit
LLLARVLSFILQQGHLLSGVTKYAAQRVHLLCPVAYLGCFVAIFTLNWSQIPLQVTPMAIIIFLGFNTFTVKSVFG